MKTSLTIPHFLTPPSTEVSHFVAADTQLVECLGVNPCFKLGELWKDTGYTQLGQQLNAGRAIGGLYWFVQDDATRKLLATTTNSGETATELWYNTGANWTQISTPAWTGSFGMRVEMETFINYCFFVGYNGASFLPVASLTNTTFSDAVNVTGMPQGRFIKRYRDRLYVANTRVGTNTPFRTYFSNVPAAGSLTWDNTTNFFDTDYSESITGLGSNWDRLMIFTERSAYMYDQVTLKKVFETGCINHRTIDNYEAYMVWLSKDNVYVSVSGGRPQPIGTPIMQLIRNSAQMRFIPSENKLQGKVVGSEYHLYLGDTSANGVSYTNCLATYNFDYGMWRWRELHDEPRSMTMSSVAQGVDRLYFGDGDGDIFRKGLPDDAIYSDDGAPIKSRFRTKAFDAGSPEILKCFTRTLAYSKELGDLMLGFRVLDKTSELQMPFTFIGPLKQPIATLDHRKDGNFIQFEGVEYGSGKPWVFEGMTMLVGPSSHQS